MRFGIAAVVLFLSCLMGEAQGANTQSTHKQLRSIVPKIDGAKVALNTFCLASDGHLWMCCSKGEKAGAIVIASHEGETIRTIDLEFAPQAINFTASGDAFVAGHGSVAKLSSTGEVLRTIEAPNLENPEEALASMRIAVEKQVETIVASLSQQLKSIDESIAKLEVVPEEESDREKTRREARLDLLKKQREQQAQSQEQMREMYVKAYASQVSVERLKRSTGLAVTKSDIFVSLPSLKGFGYSIWRMNHDLGEPTIVQENVGGCCGQMDIQSDGENLLVAANTKFKVIRYDRDGKELSSFGERSREGGAGFGSCCNPMNIRCCENGDILTAESSIGHIKRFSSDGEYLGLIGTAKIGGGCKHVAVSYDAKRDYYYMMNVDRGDVALLVPADQVTEESEDERLSREAREGLGKKLLGVWKIQREKPKAAAAAPEDQTVALETQSMATMMEQMYGYLHFHADGSLATVAPQPVRPQAAAGSIFSSIVQAITGTKKEEKTSTEGKEAAVVFVSSQANVPRQQWEPLSQKDGSLHVVIISEEIRGYGFTAKFPDDKSMEVSWFYGSPEQSMGSKSVFVRQSAPGCESGACSGEQCACPDHCEKKADAPVTTESPAANSGTEPGAAK